MKLAYLMPAAPAFGAPMDYYIGSGRKYAEALGLIAGVEVDVFAVDARDRDERLASADAAVVRADRFDHYRLALERGLSYLLIAHDLATMRDPGSEAAFAEREMIERAAAITFVTGPLAEFAAERYQLPPHAVVPLRPLAADLDFDPLPGRPHTLVYAGGVLGMASASGPWGYRANVDTFTAAARCGWTVHVYPSRLRPAVQREYAAAGCVIHAPVPESCLLRELSQYTAGLQVFNEVGVPAAARDYARLAWPAKTWLYLAAGIPTVATNPGYESCRIHGGRWGLVLDDPGGFAHLREGDLPPVDEQLRRREVIDADLPRLAGLLETVTRAAH